MTAFTAIQIRDFADKYERGGDWSFNDLLPILRQAASDREALEIDDGRREYFRRLYLKMSCAVSEIALIMGIPGLIDSPDGDYARIIDAIRQLKARQEGRHG